MGCISQNGETIAERITDMGFDCEEEEDEEK